MFGLRMRRRNRRSVPYGMFDHESYGLAAKNARVLERVYHKGHANAWDGKEVLDSLIERFGPPSLEAEAREALGRVFSIIMWGELAAWRISAELADELEPLEAKMAATSQAFDEARHFYVMHDYLVALDALPDALPWGARRLLEEVMNADHLAKKLLGMQLMVEPVALTLFHIVRKLDLEPVLTHLMPYYERDESRHVALGLQYLPAMLSQMSVRERAELWLFQFELINYEVLSNIALMRDLKLLGVEPRKLVEVGKTKQLKALDMVFKSLGVENNVPGLIMDRYADVMVELTLPREDGEGINVGGRLRRALTILRHGSDYLNEEISLLNEVTDEETPLVQAVKQRQEARTARAS